MFVYVRVVQLDFAIKLMLAQAASNDVTTRRTRQDGGHIFKNLGGNFCYDASWYN